MVAVIGVRGRHPLSGWDGHDLLKRGHGRVCLTETGLIKRLEVNGSPGLTVVFPGDDHHRTPHHRLVDIHLLQYSHRHVSVQVAVYFVFPVTWDDGRRVNRLGDSVTLQSEL